MPLNLNHFLERGRGSGDLSNEQLTEKEFLKLLTDRINSVDVEKARADVIRFIPCPTLNPCCRRNSMK